MRGAQALFPDGGLPPNDGAFQWSPSWRLTPPETHPPKGVIAIHMALPPQKRHTPMLSPSSPLRKAQRGNVPVAPRSS